MPLNDVTIVRGSGGLGRRAAGEDHTSALLFAQAPPVAWGTAKMRRYTSLKDLETDGVTETNALTALAWYQCSEFFRLAPGAALWVCFNTTYAEMLTGAEGKIRQMGVSVATTALVTSQLQATANLWRSQHAPVTIVAGFEPSATPDLAAIADGATLLAPDVALVLFGDGAAKGKALAVSLTKPYVPALGAVLGLMAAMRVSDSVTWVEKGNLSNGSELESIIMADGVVPSVSLLDALNTKRYLVARKHYGFAGTYLADSHVCNTATSDYAYVEVSRMTNKAHRLVRQVLLPRLSSPLLLDPDTGDMRDSTCKEIEALVEGVIASNMIAGDELSGVECYVDPTQPIVQTSRLDVSLSLVPVGTSRNIVVTLGLVLSV